MRPPPPADGRPKGYRKAIPKAVKMAVWIAQRGRCAIRKHKLRDMNDGIWDHQPPLWLRAWDPVARDTVPPQHDPRYLQLISREANAEKTYGRGGERRISTADGDIGKITKTRNLIESGGRHAEAMRNKAEGRPRPKKRWRWPSRPMKGRSSFR